MGMGGTCIARITALSAMRVASTIRDGGICQKNSTEAIILTMPIMGVV